MRIGHSLGLTRAIAGVFGGSVTLPGGLLSLTIADSTNIDQNGSRIGYDGNGCVAIVVLKGLTSLVGSVAPSDLTLTVSDPGYTNDGGVTSRTRTIRGRAYLRRQHPNGASKLISTDGTDLLMYIVLTDWIYAGTTIVSAEIGSSFYTGCTASSAGSTSNLSTLAYTKPVFGWENPQQEITGSTHDVAAYAFHRDAMFGQQVACIKYSVSDGTHSSATVTCSAPTLSTRQTLGQIAEVWKGTVDMSTMDNGVISNVNAIVYPWVGDSTAVLDLSTDGIAWPTRLPYTKLRVLCDRTGGYGTAYAYVDGTGGGTPAVSSVPATAKLTPYATPAAALAAIKTWNNVNKGHNDVGAGVVRLMDNAGGDKTYTISANSTNSPGATWYTIEKDPDSSAVISIEWSDLYQFPSGLRLKNLRPVGTATEYAIALYTTSSQSMLLTEGCTFNSTNMHAGLKFITWAYYQWHHNLTLTGTKRYHFNTLTDDDQGVAWIGMISGDNAARPITADGDAHLQVGCRMPLYQVQKCVNSGHGDHGRIIYNNKMLCLQWNSSTARTVNLGVAIVQNQWETDDSDFAAASMHVLADGDLTTCRNVILQCNTASGERSSHGYADVAGSDVPPSGVIKHISSRFNLMDNHNWKGDTFNSGAGGTGTMPYGYKVGCEGNVSCFGAVNRSASDAPHNDNVDSSAYMGGAWDDGEYNLRRAGLGSVSQATVLGYFHNWTAAPAAGNTIGGDLRPKTTSTPLLNRVPVNRHVLLKDLAGATRKTDGTGAAGAYEAAA